MRDRVLVEYYHHSVTLAAVTGASCANVGQVSGDGERTRGDDRSDYKLIIEWAPLIGTTLGPGTSGPNMGTVPQFYVFHMEVRRSLQMQTRQMWSYKADGSMNLVSH